MDTNKPNDQHHRGSDAAAKWATLINDRLLPMPRRKLTARDILDQSGHGQDVVLVRDHGGVHDVTFDGDVTVDLADGNVFRAVPRCEVKPSAACTEPAKRCSSAMMGGKLPSSASSPAKR